MPTRGNVGNGQHQMLVDEQRINVLLELLVFTQTHNDPIYLGSTIYFVFCCCWLSHSPFSNPSCFYYLVLNTHSTLASIILSSANEIETRVPPLYRSTSPSSYTAKCIFLLVAYFTFLCCCLHLFAVALHAYDEQNHSIRVTFGKECVCLRMNNFRGTSVFHSYVVLRCWGTWSNTHFIQYYYSGWILCLVGSIHCVCTSYYPPWWSTRFYECAYTYIILLCAPTILYNSHFTM